jgi:hypothetical protein
MLRALQDYRGLLTHNATCARDQRSIAVGNLTAISPTHYLSDTFNRL